MTSWTPCSPRSRSDCKNSVQKAASSESPMETPSTSRLASCATPVATTTAQLATSDGIRGPEPARPLWKSTVNLGPESFEEIVVQAARIDTAALEVPTQAVALIVEASEAPGQAEGQVGRVTSAIPCCVVTVVPRTPTARHSAGVGHAMPMRSPPLDGVFTMAHECPFHCALLPPTAQQSRTDAQASPSKVARTGAATRCQAPPWSRNMRPPRAVAAAQHMDGARHVTARTSPEPPGSPRLRQTCPFQCSPSNLAPADCVLLAPTAQQLASDVQLTPPSADPVGLGAPATDQLLPFQCSTRTPTDGVPPFRSPTAQQFAPDRQLTPFKMSLPVVLGLGVGSICQPWPLQCSA